MKRLFSHKNKEKKNIVENKIEYAKRNRLTDLEMLTFFLWVYVIIQKRRF